MLRFEDLFSSVFIDGLHEWIRSSREDLHVTTIATQDHTCAIFARGKFHMRHVVGVDQPQEDSLRIADTAVGHFEVRLRRRYPQFGSDATLVVDQFECVASNYRSSALRVTRLCTHNLQRQNSEVQEDKAPKHAVGFHVRLDAYPLGKVARLAAIRAKPNKALELTTFAVTSHASVRLTEMKPRNPNRHAAHGAGSPPWLIFGRWAKKFMSAHGQAGTCHSAPARVLVFRAAPLTVLSIERWQRETAR